jgi:aminoglycoside phosphotransferase (APT) family kinase protein
MEEAREILGKESIEYSSVEKISEDAGRMKDIYRIQTNGKGEIGLYKYKQGKAGERGRTIKQRINAEIYTFQQIGEKTSSRTPEIISTDHHNYIICNWLKGKNTGTKIENNQQKEKLAKKLGEALAEIHSIQYQKFGEINQNGIEKPYKNWKNFLQNVIDFLKQFNSEEIAEKGIGYLENNIEQVSGSFEPVLVHGDYHAWNTVIDQKGELGILDCEASFIGCREFEINRALGHWAEEHEVKEPFLDAYGRDNLKDGWEDRRQYYEILHATMGLIDGIRMESEHLQKINREGLQENLKQ